jgi:hypothetical protein
MTQPTTTPTTSPLDQDDPLDASPVGSTAADALELEEPDGTMMRPLLLPVEEPDDGLKLLAVAAGVLDDNMTSPLLLSVEEAGEELKLLVYAIAAPLDDDDDDRRADDELTLAVTRAVLDDEDDDD